MNILVACEESQAVCMACRELGHNAFSCDIQPCSGGHPEFHIMKDVVEILNPTRLWGDIDGCMATFYGISFSTCDGKRHVIYGKWDMIIAHPPCTYLTNAGARHLYPKGVLNQERYQKGLAAKEFFMKIYNADCDKIAIENPIPSKIYELPPYSQTIQPWMFGHPFKKKTCLWLKGLPLLQPTDIIPEDMRESTKIAGNWFNKGGKERQKNRAKTFPKIAKAMAIQWCGVCENENTNM